MMVQTACRNITPSVHIRRGPCYKQAHAKKAHILKFKFYPDFAWVRSSTVSDKRRISSVKAALQKIVIIDHQPPSLVYRRQQLEKEKLFFSFALLSLPPSLLLSRYDGFVKPPVPTQTYLGKFNDVSLSLLPNAKLVNYHSPRQKFVLAIFSWQMGKFWIVCWIYYAWGCARFISGIEGISK